MLLIALHDSQKQVVDAAEEQNEDARSYEAHAGHEATHRQDGPLPRDEGIGKMTSSW